MPMSMPIRRGVHRSCHEEGEHSLGEFLMAYAPYAAAAAPHRFPYVLGEAFEPQGHLVEGGDASAGVLPPSPRLQSFLHLRQRDHTNEQCDGAPQEAV